MKTRLIHYIVVDVDLAKKCPQHAKDAILTSGEAILVGEDQTLMLDLAPEISLLLEKHNTKRRSVIWTDDDGKDHQLQTIRASQLDITITTIKTY